MWRNGILLCLCAGFVQSTNGVSIASVTSSRSQWCRTEGGPLSGKPGRRITYYFCSEPATETSRTPAPFDFLHGSRSADEARESQASWSRYCETPVEVAAGPDIKLRLIPPGEFVMCDGPDHERIIDAVMELCDITELKRAEIAPQLVHEVAHPVRISRPYWIGAHEITVGQFRRFVDDTGYETDVERAGKGLGVNLSNRILFEYGRYSWRRNGFRQANSHPVVNVTWNDAQEFVKWLNEKHGGGWSLPTEAQWEFACRAGTSTLFSMGDDLGLVGRKFNSLGTAGELPHRLLNPNRFFRPEDGFFWTAPVGSFAPNPFGLYDMHGNANEWTRDAFTSFEAGKSVLVDPDYSPDESDYIAIKGGSWNNDFDDLRSVARRREKKGAAGPSKGFRVVRTTGK